LAVNAASRSCRQTYQFRANEVLITILALVLSPNERCCLPNGTSMTMTIGWRKGLDHHWLLSSRRFETRPAMFVAV
jgi:hypothetical protein